MDDQGPRAAQPDQQVLAPAVHRVHGAAGQLPDEPSWMRGVDRRRAEHAYSGDVPARDSPAKPAGNRLNVREFWHPLVERHPCVSVRVNVNHRSGGIALSILLVSLVECLVAAVRRSEASGGGGGKGIFHLPPILVRGSPNVASSLPGI